MLRSRSRLATVAVAGLLLAACGGGDDTSTSAPNVAATSAPPDAQQTQDDDSGGDATRTETDDAGAGMDGGDGMGMMGAYGEPADASEADRTIEVATDNSLVFDPAEYEVAVGEVVTFRITNSGDIEHEFVLGDEHVQQQMAEAMSGGGDAHAHSGEMSNAVTIHGGEVGEVTWRFPDEPTTVLVGCHVPGHYDAGMRGTITVR